MRWIVVASVLALSGPALGQGDYQAWVQDEFPSAYQQVQRCLPMTVRWTAQTGDSAQAEIWLDGADTYLRTEVPMVSGDGARSSDILTLVDFESDGTINRATMGGETFSGKTINQYPMLTVMFHTVVAVAAADRQCPR